MGAWLNALSVSSLGLRMSNDTVRIAIGLRVGAPLCLPHTCACCGEPVDNLGLHGLSSQAKGEFPAIRCRIISSTSLWPLPTSAIGLNHLDFIQSGWEMSRWGHSRSMVWREIPRVGYDMHGHILQLPQKCSS